jgi:hypothetical protein
MRGATRLQIVIRKKIGVCGNFGEEVVLRGLVEDI